MSCLPARRGPPPAASFDRQCGRHEMDGSGRVVVPPRLREYARLDKRAMLVGQLNKFQLWNEDDWNAISDADRRPSSNPAVCRKNYVTLSCEPDQPPATYHRVARRSRRGAERARRWSLSGRNLRAGGHSRLLLQQLGPNGQLLGFDKDPLAIATGQALAAEDGRFVVVQRSFAELGDEVAQRGWTGV